MILLWDQDGIFCDFVSHAATTFDKNLNDIINNWHGTDIEENLGVTKSEFWKKIDKIPDWWETIPKTKECDELLKIASQYDSYICTSPASNPNCAAGKLRWLNMYTSFRRNIVITPQKWLCAGPNKILIDDTDSKIEKFREHGGHGILFPRVWNKNKHLADNPISFLKSELERIKNET